METRRIGELEVSVVGLGCNNFGGRIDEERSRAVVHAALDAGVTLFDTADVYGSTRSEEYLGRALGRRRDEAVIATKFGAQLGDDPAHGGGHPRWVRQAADGSLRRLGVDHIDLYQLHRPDPDVPVEDTLGAMHELVVAGKVRVIGHSNFSAEQVDEAAAAAVREAVTPFASAQNHYNLLARAIERDVIPACQRHGLAMLPYFPLASGLLTGKYRRGEEAPDGTRVATMDPSRAERLLSDRHFDVVERLEELATSRERTLLELAMSWLAAQPTVASVIAGATRPEQVRDNVAAVGWHLSDDDLATIDDLSAPALEEG
ncbi:MAG TPA: aldo/keto reductase [Acidimicrobiales bacterium]|jgi:aryl-alcohol dehydrogenase-like predicted oxidoreductase